MDSIVDSSFLDKINGCAGGNFDDDDEKDDDEEERQKEMLAMLEQQLPDDLLDDSCTDDDEEEIDLTQDQSQMSEEDNQGSPMHNSDAEDMRDDGYPEGEENDGFEHIKLINGQEFRPTHDLYQMTPQKQIVNTRYDTNELLDMVGAADDNNEPHRSVKSPVGGSQSPKKALNNNNYHSVPIAFNQAPVPYQQPMKPTNFSTVSAISENFENEVHDQRTPNKQLVNTYNPTSEFRPPQASTAIRGNEVTPPPNQQHPEAFRRRDMQLQNVNENHPGGSYLSSASSNANSWSFEVFGKNPNKSPEKRSPSAQSQPQRNQPQQSGQNEHMLDESYRNYDFGNGDYPERVFYRPRNSTAQHHLSNSMDANNITPPRRNPRATFMEAGGVTNDQQLVQLNILYEARGKRIEELQAELEAKTADSAKQIRILQHQLSISDESATGLKTSLDTAMAGQYELKNQLDQLQRTVRSRDKQIESLSTAKQEAEQKVQVMERTVASLNSQMEEMCRSDMVSRSREQHETAVRSLTHKHQNELRNLNQQIVALQVSVEQKSDEVDKLASELADVEKVRSSEKVRQADVVNKLTQSLEDSQRQCRDLLNTNSAVETASLQSQLKQITMSKKMSDQIGKMLQDEVNDLRTQLAQYEAVSSLKLGIFPSIEKGLKGDGLDEQDMHDESVLNATSTMPNRDSASDSEYIQKLKNELEKCLINNFSKRNRIDKLNKELEKCQESLTAVKWDQAQVEKEKRDLELKNALLMQQKSESVGSRKSSEREAKSSQVETEKMRSELENIIKELEDKMSNEQEKFEGLSTEMVQKLTDYEKEKQESIERTRNTCLTMHEDAQENLRAELGRYYEQEKQQIVQSFEAELEELREKLKSTAEECDYAKSCFVKLSEETKMAEQQKNLERFETCTQTEDDAVSESAEDEKKKLAEEIVELETKIESLKGDCRAVSKAKEVVETKLKEREDSHTEALTKLQKDFNQVQIQLKAAKELLRKEREQNQTHSESVTSSKEEYEAMIKKKDEMISQLETEKQRLEKLNRELESNLESEAKSLESVYKESADELRKLLDEEAKKRSSLEQECSELKSNIEDLNLDITNWSVKHRKLQRCFENEQSSNTEREKERDRLKAELDKYKKKVESLSTEIEIKINETRSATERDFEDKEAELRNNVTELQKKLQAASRNDSKLKLELKALKEQQVSESNQAILMMDKKIAQIQQKLENKSPREQSRQVSCAEKATQTHSSDVSGDSQTLREKQKTQDAASMDEFRTSVIDTIKMMKADVVDYVLTRQEEICSVLRDEMHKDQQLMSQQMHQNYLSSLEHVLVNELLPKVQQDMEVTSDIRHLVSTMSENMSTTPMTSSRSSPHSGSNSAAEPTSTKAHSQQLQQQMNNLQEVAQFPAHMIANQNAPRANETKINKNSRPVSVDLHPGDSGDNMSCHSQSSQNAANGVFVAPLAINSQAQSRNQQQSSKSSVRRDRPVVRKKTAKEHLDTRRRSEELNNMVLEQQQLQAAQLNQTQVPYVNGLLDTSVTGTSHQNEVLAMNDYTSRSNSLPRRLHQSNSMMSMKNVYSDIQPQTSQNHQYQRLTSREENPAVHNYSFTSTPRDQYFATSQTSNHTVSYRPSGTTFTPARVPASTNPYLSGSSSATFASYPAFQVYHGSPSNHSEVSTDTYANLPKTFSMSRPRASVDVNAPSISLSKDGPSKSRTSSSSRLLHNSNSLRFSHSSNSGY
ncbi:centrosomal protein of 152 kDa-like isoform X2 [Symsagittifera roscoffensis]|uniref:centrosomal protein of 152 kDa-like isoform X2 n=1 Tax=Symsagittifera roscoffensis TaxID=84072 RepID=UPI00307C9C94